MCAAGRGVEESAAASTTAAAHCRAARAAHNRRRRAAAAARPFSRETGTPTAALAGGIDIIAPLRAHLPFSRRACSCRLCRSNNVAATATAPARAPAQTRESGRLPAGGAAGGSHRPARRVSAAAALPTRSALLLSVSLRARRPLGYVLLLRGHPHQEEERRQARLGRGPARCRQTKGRPAMLGVYACALCAASSPSRAASRTIGCAPRRDAARAIGAIAVCRSRWRPPAAPTFSRESDRVCFTAKH